MHYNAKASLKSKYHFKTIRVAENSYFDVTSQKCMYGYPINKKFRKAKKKRKKKW